MSKLKMVKWRQRFGTAAKTKGESREKGMPGVKPGKSRRSGGYYPSSAIKRDSTEKECYPSFALKMGSTKKEC